MNYSFEQQKNIKASLYTIISCGILFLLFFFYRWSAPILLPEESGQGVEVHLGNSDDGMGSIPYTAPGNYSPTPDASASNSTPTSSEEVHNTTMPDPESNVSVENNKKSKKDISTVQPAVVIPRPKAVFKANTALNRSTGGTMQDSYSAANSQGVTGKTGVQGKENGNPLSDNYTGNAGTGGNGAGGIRMSGNLVNRGTTYLPDMLTSENWRGTVALRITIDASGKVIKVQKLTLGTSPTLNNDAISFAMQQAYLLHYNTSSLIIETGNIYLQFRY